MAFGDKNLALAASEISERRKEFGWSHVRARVVVPIGVIVALAIVCIVVTVLGSARRADEVALDNERQLFTRSLNHHAERVLREVEAIATSEAGVRNIRMHFDPVWIQNRVGLRLQTLFDQDFVFIADASDQFVYSMLGSRSVDPNRLNSIKTDLMPALDLQRGRAGDRRDAVVAAGPDGMPPGGQYHRVVRLQAFLGRPAIVTAVAVAARSDTAAYLDVPAPVLLSVKFIDEDVLAEIAARLHGQVFGAGAEAPEDAHDEAELERHAQQSLVEQRPDAVRMAHVEALQLGLHACLVHDAKQVADVLERVLEYEVEDEFLPPGRVLRVVHRPHVERG